MPWERFNPVYFVDGIRAASLENYVDRKLKANNHRQRHRFTNWTVDTSDFDQKIIFLDENDF